MKNNYKVSAFKRRRTCCSNHQQFGKVGPPAQRGSVVTSRSQSSESPGGPGRGRSVELEFHTSRLERKPLSSPCGVETGARNSEPTTWAEQYISHALQHFKCQRNVQMGTPGRVKLLVFAALMNTVVPTLPQESDTKLREKPPSLHRTGIRPPIFPVTGNPIYYESDALDHFTTIAICNVDPDMPPNRCGETGAANWGRLRTGHWEDWVLRQLWAREQDTSQALSSFLDNVMRSENDFAWINNFLQKNYDKIKSDDSKHRYKRKVIGIDQDRMEEDHSVKVFGGGQKYKDLDYGRTMSQESPEPIKKISKTSLDTIGKTGNLQGNPKEDTKLPIFDEDLVGLSRNQGKANPSSDSAKEVSDESVRGLGDATNAKNKWKKSKSSFTNKYVQELNSLISNQIKNLRDSSPKKEAEQLSAETNRLGSLNLQSNERDGMVLAMENKKHNKNYHHPDSEDPKKNAIKEITNDGGMVGNYHREDRTAQDKSNYKSVEMGKSEENSGADAFNKEKNEAELVGDGLKYDYSSSNLEDSSNKRTNVVSIRDKETEFIKSSNPNEYEVESKDFDNIEHPDTRVEAVPEIEESLPKEDINMHTALVQGAESNIGDIKIPSGVKLRHLSQITGFEDDELNNNENRPLKDIFSSYDEPWYDSNYRHRKRPKESRLNYDVSDENIFNFPIGPSPQKRETSLSNVDAPHNIEKPSYNFFDSNTKPMENLNFFGRINSENNGKLDDTNSDVKDGNNMDPSQNGPINIHDEAISQIFNLTDTVEDHVDKNKIKKKIGATDSKRKNSPKAIVKKNNVTLEDRSHVDVKENKNHTIKEAISIKKDGDKENILQKDFTNNKNTERENIYQVEDPKNKDAERENNDQEEVSKNKDADTKNNYQEEVHKNKEDEKENNYQKEFKDGKESHTDDKEDSNTQEKFESDINNHKDVEEDKAKQDTFVDYDIGEDVKEGTNSQDVKERTKIQNEVVKDLLQNKNKDSDKNKDTSLWEKEGVSTSGDAENFKEMKPNIGREEHEVDNPTFDSEGDKTPKQTDDQKDQLQRIPDEKFRIVIDRMDPGKTGGTYPALPNSGAHPNDGPASLKLKQPREKATSHSFELFDHGRRKWDPNSYDDDYDDQPQDDEQTDGFLTGDLPLWIVDQILKQTHNAEHLRDLVGPGLLQTSRFALNGKPDINLLNETSNNKNFQARMQHMLVDVVDMVHRLTDDEVNKRSCYKLPMRLQSFLEWMLSKPRSTDQSYTQSMTEPFLFDKYTNVVVNYTEEIHRKINLLHRLIAQYESLSADEKEKVEPIHDYLYTQINALNMLLGLPQLSPHDKTSSPHHETHSTRHATHRVNSKSHHFTKNTQDYPQAIPSPRNGGSYPNDNIKPGTRHDPQERPDYSSIRHEKKDRYKYPPIGYDPYFKDRHEMLLADNHKKKHPHEDDNVDPWEKPQSNVPNMHLDSPDDYDYSTPDKDDQNEDDDGNLDKEVTYHGRASGEPEYRVPPGSGTHPPSPGNSQGTRVIYERERVYHYPHKGNNRSQAASRVWSSDNHLSDSRRTREIPQYLDDVASPKGKGEVEAERIFGNGIIYPASPKGKREVEAERIFGNGIIDPASPKGMGGVEAERIFGNVIIDPDEGLASQRGDDSPWPFENVVHKNDNFTERHNIVIQKFKKWQEEQKRIRALQARYGESDDGRYSLKGRSPRHRVILSYSDPEEDEGEDWYISPQYTRLHKMADELEQKKTGERQSARWKARRRSMRREDPKTRKNNSKKNKNKIQDLKNENYA
uniref:Uncharacterized protein n=1 Tax=Timema poppense TaxID=170557 RepID=A0A7R9DGT7_TIMPO|nr:unnamed protein product [Timema poppensis]